MHKLSSPGQSGEQNVFYWWRVTSFVPGATVQIDNTVYTVDCNESGICPKGKAFKLIALTGTVNVELGDNEFEEYPGPVAPNPFKSTVFLNVKDFGAKGDGVSDDTAAIAAAIATGGAGATIFFPAGTYLVTGNPAIQPLAGQTLFGSSRGSTTISYGGVGDCILIESVQSVSIRALRILISSANGTERGIHINNTTAPSQWHNLEDLAFIQFPTARTLGVVGIYVESVAARAQFWNHFRRIIVQGFDKGVRLNGATNLQVVNGQKFYDLMGPACITVLELTRNASDNTLDGMFVSASGFGGPLLGIQVGNGVDVCAGNIFKGINVDAGVTGKPWDVQAGCIDNYFECANESTLAPTDAGTRTTFRTMKVVAAASPNISSDSTSTTAPPYFAIVYSPAMTPDARNGNTQEIAANNAVAFTVNAPTNPIKAGQKLTFKVKNTTGGALGAATWNAIFKMAAWVQPGAGNSRSITFHYDGTNWVEETRTPNDVPN